MHVPVSMPTIMPALPCCCPTLHFPFSFVINLCDSVHRHDAAGAAVCAVPADATQAGKAALNVSGRLPVCSMWQTLPYELLDY